MTTLRRVAQGERWSRPPDARRGVGWPAFGAAGVGGVLVGAMASLDPLIALVVVVSLLVGVAVLRRPAVGALLLVALVPVTSGLRPGLPVPALRLSEALIIAIAGGTLLLRHRDDALPWRGLDWLALAYLGGTLVLGLANIVPRGDGFGEEALSIMLGPFQFFLLYRAVATGLRQPSDRRLAVRLLFFASVPVSIIAILQQQRLFGVQELIVSLTRSGAFNTWGFINYPRATSVFPSWHPLAGYLALVVLLAIATFTLKKEDRPLPAGGLAVVCVLALAGIVQSQTFTAMFAVMAGCVIIIWLARATKLLGWVLVGAATFVLFAGSFLGTRLDQQFADDSGTAVPQTVGYRFEVWGDQYYPVMTQYWQSGYGPVLPDEIEWRHTESLYLTLLLRGGVPLLTVYVLLMAVIARYAYHRLRHGDPTTRAIANAILASVIVLGPMNAVWPYFTASGLAQIFWVLLGLLVAGRWGAGIEPASLEHPALEPGMPSAAVRHVHLT